MAHLFQFNKHLIINLDKIETILMNRDQLQHDREEGLSLYNQIDRMVALKYSKDPTMKETWNRLQRIAATTRLVGLSVEDTEEK